MLLMPLITAACNPVAAPFGVEILDRGVVCADAGAGGYQAFPDVVRLASGDLLCVFYAGYDHISFPREGLPDGARICASRSRDNGRTWEPPTIVADTPWDDRDPSVAQMADGTLICNWFTYTHGQERHREGNEANYKEIYLAFSRDDGATWGEPVLMEPTANDHFACSSPVRVLSDGTLLMPIYHELVDPLRCTSSVIRSTDGGVTWSSPVPVDAANQDNDEPDIIELPDGRLLCAMRTNAGAETMMWQSFSTDRGLTWSPSAPMAFTGHAPYLLRTTRGALLCAHRMPVTSLHVSGDEGATWGGNVPIDTCIGAYQSMCELPDGTVLMVYYEEGPGSRIVWARLDVRPAEAPE